MYARRIDPSDLAFSLSLHQHDLTLSLHNNQQIFRIFQNVSENFCTWKLIPEKYVEFFWGHVDITQCPLWIVPYSMVPHGEYTFSVTLIEEFLWLTLDLTGSVCPHHRMVLKRRISFGSPCVSAPPRLPSNSDDCSFTLPTLRLHTQCENPNFFFHTVSCPCNAKRVVLTTGDLQPFWFKPKKKFINSSEKLWYRNNGIVRRWLSDRTSEWAVKKITKLLNCISF